MKILIRLPNWLGDLVMSSAFIKAVHRKFPNSIVDVMVKKNLSGILPLLTGINRVYEISTQSTSNIFSHYWFLKKNNFQNYDLFFCLPNSFSSALIGFFSKSNIRIGYKNELRAFLLTHSYSIPERKHRAEEYIFLLEKYTGKKITNLNTELSSDQFKGRIIPDGKNIILNFNSVAQSRRVPVTKAVEIITKVQSQFDYNLLLIGSLEEVNYTRQIENLLAEKKNIYNYAGKLNLIELAQIIYESDLLLTTDSGIAHLANAFHKKTVVLFGAGDEINTRPYNYTKLQVMRAKNIDCAPCISNQCKLGTPICLTEINSGLIINSLREVN